MNQLVHLMDSGAKTESALIAVWYVIVLRIARIKATNYDAGSTNARTSPLTNAHSGVLTLRPTTTATATKVETSNAFLNGTDHNIPTFFIPNK